MGHAIKRQVISRSVTSCTCMTVAQTKVGFLTGGRGQKLREEERHAQEEEAYARATVALTRARKMCFIFCPLDMKGLIGAATVMGSLMYGAGHCWHWHNQHAFTWILVRRLSRSQPVSQLAGSH